MTGDPNSEASDADELDLDVLQEDIEQVVRAVEMRARQLMSNFDTERISLLDRLREEQKRVREREIQLATARQDAEQLRGHLATVNAKLARHEKDVDALEDEIDLMITRVEARALGALKKSEARTKQVLQAKAEAERELAKRFRMALREQEEIAASTQRAMVEAHQVEITALATEIDHLNSQLSSIKISLSWRLTRPFRRSSE